MKGVPITGKELTLESMKYWPQIIFGLRVGSGLKVCIKSLLSAKGQQVAKVVGSRK